MILRLLTLSILTTINLAAEPGVISSSTDSERVLNNESCKHCGGHKKANRPKGTFSPRVKVHPVRR